MIRQLLVTIVSALVVCVIAPTAALAAGYGPPTPPASNAPGGFQAVLTAKTIGTEGGSLGASVAGSQVKVRIPAGALSSPAVVELVAPQLSAIPDAVAAVGVYLFVNGKKFTGHLATPATITISDPGIAAGDRVEVWNGSSFVAASGSTVRAGKASVRFSSDPDFAVLRGISAAAIPATGVPLLGETLLAVGLIVAGVAVALIARRRWAST